MRKNLNDISILILYLKFSRYFKVFKSTFNFSKPVGFQSRSIIIAIISRSNNKQFYIFL